MPSIDKNSRNVRKKTFWSQFTQNELINICNSIRNDVNDFRFFFSSVSFSTCIKHHTIDSFVYWIETGNSYSRGLLYYRFKCLTGHASLCLMKGMRYEFPEYSQFCGLFSNFFSFFLSNSSTWSCLKEFVMKMNDFN